MDVILLEHIRKLGRIGDEITVRNGYARNYLLPRGKAIPADDANRREFAQRRHVLEAKNLELRGDAEKMKEKIDGVAVTIIRQAGETGRLYGSVTRRDIAAALAEIDIAIAPQQVGLDVTVKALGLYDISLILHPEIVTTISVNVARSDEDAQHRLEAAAAGQDENETDENERKIAAAGRDDDEDAAEKTETEQGDDHAAAADEDKKPTA